MSYADTVKLAVDTIKNKKDFYIDLSDSINQARLHLFVTNIGGKDWYNVSTEIFNGREFVAGPSCSANDLHEFKHVVGVCWHYVQNNAKVPLSYQIQSASARTVAPFSIDKALEKQPSFER